MWITRRQHETLFAALEQARQETKDLMAALVYARANEGRTAWERFATAMGTVAEQKARLASLEAHVSWLAQHVNRLEIERTQLLARLSVAVPVPTIEFQPGVPDVGRGVPHTDESVVPEPDPAGSVEAALHQSVSFEDMGDAAAAREGITHDAAGLVAYLR